MRRVGILGGTFDPPHLGHLIIAEEVRIELELEEIWFIPSHTPPHKNEAKTGVADRIAMLTKAIESNPYFKINKIEVERTGKSYTFDTIKMLNEENRDIEFYFIIGADMVEYLPHWNRIDELIHLVKFVGVKRSGHVLNVPYPVMKVEIPMIDISSTMIRNRLLNNRPVHYFMVESVYSYIKEKRLYENR